LEHLSSLWKKSEGLVNELQAKARGGGTIYGVDVGLIVNEKASQFLITLFTCHMEWCLFFRIFLWVTERRPAVREQTREQKSREKMDSMKEMRERTLSGLAPARRRMAAASHLLSMAARCRGRCAEKETSLAQEAAPHIRWR